MYIRNYCTADTIRPATELEISAYLALIDHRNHTGAVMGTDLADDLRYPDGTSLTVYINVGA